jgi:hypothetical protein
MLLLTPKKDPLITYEKAFLGQATGGKFPSVTFIERKQMSTKTSIKRIALVAAAALTLGGFTAVSASASTTASTLKVTGSYGTVATDGLSGIQTAGGIMEVTLTETSTTGVLGTLTSTGVGSITALTLHGTASVPTATTYPTPSVTISTTGDASGTTQVLNVSSAVAGTQTVTFTPIDDTGAPGTAKSVTITWGSKPTISVQYSKVGTSTSTSAGTAFANPSSLTKTDVLVPATSLSVSSSTNTGSGIARAYIEVVPFDSNGTNKSAEKLTWTVTGPGSLGIAAFNADLATTFAAATNTGRSLTDTVGGKYFGVVYSDGVSGASTVTVSDGTVVLATVAVTFTGSAKKVVAVQNLKVLKAGGSVTTADDNSSGKADYIYNGSWSSYYSGRVLTDGGLTAAYTATSTNIPTPAITVP